MLDVSLKAHPAGGICRLRLLFVSLKSWRLSEGSTCLRYRLSKWGNTLPNWARGARPWLSIRQRARLSCLFFKCKHFVRLHVCLCTCVYSMWVGVLLCTCMCAHSFVLLNSNRQHPSLTWKICLCVLKHQHTTTKLDQQNRINLKKKKKMSLMVLVFFMYTVLYMPYLLSK